MKRRNDKFALIFSLLFLALLGFSGLADAREKTATEMNQQILKEKNTLKKIKAQIKKNKKDTLVSKKKEHSILSKIEGIDRRFSLLRKEAGLLELKIQKNETEAEVLSKRVKEVTLEIKTGRKIILNRVKTIYKEKQGSSIEILFSAQSYPDLLRKIQYLKTIAQKEEEILTRFKVRSGELEEKKEHLNQVLEQMLSDRELLAKKLLQSRTERKKKKRLLTRVRKERTFFKKAILEMTQSSKKVETFIASLEKKKKEFSVSIPGKFSKAKGGLRWPSDGRIAARFGRQKHPRFNTMIYRKGIEIAPDRGGDVRTIFGGIVVYADWFRGYGMMVMVDHGENYYSLYAHLAKLFVGVGENVRKDRIIGEVGGTGLSQGPKLYFEIRHQGEPTNPLSWLQKKR